jgi:hypothetical protein
MIFDGRVGCPFSRSLNVTGLNGREPISHAAISLQRRQESRLNDLPDVSSLSEVMETFVVMARDSG